MRWDTVARIWSNWTNNKLLGMAITRLLFELSCVWWSHTCAWIDCEWIGAIGWSCLVVSERKIERERERETVKRERRLRVDPHDTEIRYSLGSFVALCVPCDWTI